MGQIVDVGDAVPVDDRGDLELGGRRRTGGPGAAPVAGALAVQAGRGGEHAGGQRQMAAGGVAGHHDAPEVEVELPGVAVDPAQRATAVLDGGRRVRRVRQPVGDVDHAPAHLQVGEEGQRGRFLAAVGPAAAVDVDERRGRFGRPARAVHVERQVPSAGAVVGDVRGQAVAGGHPHERGRRVAGLRAGRRRRAGHDRRGEADRRQAGESRHCRLTFFPSLPVRVPKVFRTCRFCHSSGSPSRPERAADDPAAAAAFG